MANTAHRDFGALVGWKSRLMGERVALHMQCVTKAPPHGSGDVHSHIYLLDRQQALQLGNYLFEMAFETRPSRRGRSLLARLFG